MEPSSSSAYLRTLGELAALTTLLLPAVGAAASWLQFSPDPRFGDVGRVALAAPVTELAATGLRLSGFALFLFAAASVVGRFGPRFAAKSRRKIESTDDANKLQRRMRFN